MKKNNLFTSFLILISFLFVSCLALSENPEQFNVETSQVTALCGPEFFDLPDYSWVNELRISAGRKKLAVYVKHREGDNILKKFTVMNPDCTDKQEITAETFAEFNKPSSPELPEETEKKLREYLEENFKPYPGILGGTVRHDIISLAYSPDKSKIAFLIQAEDGHAIFETILFAADNKGRNITRIDFDLEEMCEDIVWISNNGIIYAKSLRLWKAVIK